VLAANAEVVALLVVQDIGPYVLLGAAQVPAEDGGNLIHEGILGAGAPAGPTRTDGGGQLFRLSPALVDPLGVASSTVTRIIRSRVFSSSSHRPP
jgi:hypothetical protein